MLSKEAISYGRGGEGEEGGRGLLCCTCEWEGKVAWTLDVYLQCLVYLKVFRLSFVVLVEELISIVC